jgi:hypothetical protein
MEGVKRFWFQFPDRLRKDSVPRSASPLIFAFISRKVEIIVGALRAVRADMRISAVDRKPHFAEVTVTACPPASPLLRVLLRFYSNHLSCFVHIKHLTQRDCLFILDTLQQ